MALVYEIIWRSWFAVSGRERLPPQPFCCDWHRFGGRKEGIRPGDVAWVGSLEQFWCERRQLWQRLSICEALGGGYGVRGGGDGLRDVCDLFAEPVNIPTNCRDSYPVFEDHHLVFLVAF